MLKRNLTAVAAIGVLVYTLISPATALRAAPGGPGLTEFDSAAFNFTVDYPASWRQVPNTPLSLDLAVKSADGNVYLVATGQAVSGTPETAAALRHDLSSTLMDEFRAGRQQPHLHLSTRRVHGVTYQVGDGSGVSKKGNQVYAVGYIARAGQYYVLFVGLVRLASPTAGNPRAGMEREQLQQAFNSITFHA